MAKHHTRMSESRKPHATCIPPGDKIYPFHLTGAVGVVLSLARRWTMDDGNSERGGVAQNSCPENFNLHC